MKRENTIPARTIVLLLRFLSILLAKTPLNTVTNPKSRPTIGSVNTARIAQCKPGDDDDAGAEDTGGNPSARLAGSRRIDCTDGAAGGQ